MSQSARPALALSIILAMGLLIGALMLRQGNQRGNTEVDTDAREPSESRIDVRQNRIATNQTRAWREKSDIPETTAPRARTTGVLTVPLQTPEVIPPLTGYVVDQFRDWDQIPQGYQADGLVVRAGSVTLEGDAKSTAARVGVLVSPPIRLGAPALAGTVKNNKPLPAGAQVQLEISLSENGADWSPWVALDRDRPPDGNLVSAPIQPSLANGDHGMAGDRGSTETVTGPSLRYRLHLSASGVAGPSVEDVRVWKREYQ